MLLDITKAASKELSEVLSPIPGDNNPDSQVVIDEIKKKFPEAFSALSGYVACALIGVTLCKPSKEEMSRIMDSIPAFILKLLADANNTTLPDELLAKS